jgi:hypothetical protein
MGALIIAQWGNSQMEIRKIHPGEIDDIFVLFHQHTQEAIQSMPELADEIDDGALLNTLRSWSIQHHMCFLVAFEGQRPIGYVAGGVAAQPWSKKLYAQIVLIFLTENSRGMENFKALVDKFEEWAKSVNAIRIVAGDIGVNIDRTRKIFTYLNFTEGLSVKREIKYV